MMRSVLRVNDWNNLKEIVFREETVKYFTTFNKKRL